MRLNELQSGDEVMVRLPNSSVIHARIDALPALSTNPIAVYRVFRATRKLARHPIFIWPDEVIELLRRNGSGAISRMMCCIPVVKGDRR